MKDYLVMFFASLTVMMCLARLGCGMSNDFMDYKRDPRSTTLNRDTLSRMLSGLARERTFLVDPEHNQLKKRQSADLGMFSSWDILRDAFENAKNERERQRTLALNADLLSAAGRR